MKEASKLVIKNIMKQITRKEIESYIRFYQSQGFSLVPIVHGDKKPLVEWTELQKRKLSEAEIEKWFLSGQSANIGIVCGSISGNLVVVDFDAGDPDKGLKMAQKVFGAGIIKDTLITKTARGVHVYLKSQYPVRTLHLEDVGVDVQSEGAYVIAPPSLHPSGKEYTVERALVPVMEWEGDIVEDLFEKLRRIDKKFKADKYRQPVNVGDTLKGVEEGARDRSALELATYYRQKEKTEEETFLLLDEWNSQNKPPMNEGQLRKCLRSAFKNEKPYKFKFIELIAETFSGAVEEESERLLENPEIIPFILQATNEIIEEEDNRVSTFLLELVGESFELAGESSSGKNTILDAVLGCFPKNMYIKMTGQSARALRYMKKAPTIYFAERGGFQAGKEKGEESISEYDIKVAISEGKLVTYTTGKDENGKWETQSNETEIRNFVMTTTDVDVTPELKNRIWQTSTDYAPEHVGAIVERKFGEKEKLPSERINTSNEKNVLKCTVQKLLNKQWHPIIKNYVIPFAKELKVILDEEPRASRDAEKLMKAIYASALLHQRNRPIIEDASNKVIVCTPEDLYNVLTYCKDAVFSTFSGGQENKWYRTRWESADAILKAGKTLNPQTFSRVAEVGQTASYKWLERFVNDGLLYKNKEHGKTWYTTGSVQEEFTPLRVGVEKLSGLNLADLWKRTESWMISKGYHLFTLKERNKINLEKKLFSVGCEGEKVKKCSKTYDTKDLPDAPAYPEDYPPN